MSVTLRIYRRFEPRRYIEIDGVRHRLATVMPKGSGEGPMIRDGHVECESCTAAIDVSAVVPEHLDAIGKQSFNELLVDYGWLPTSKGCYCPAHAAEARARF